MNLLRLPRPELVWKSDLARFLEQARALLGSDDEGERRYLEDALIEQLPALRAAGLFEVFEVRDPALRRMLHDAAELPPSGPRLAAF